MVPIERYQFAIGWKALSNPSQHISSHNVFVIERMPSWIAGVNATSITFDYIAEVDKVGQVPSAF
jgi:hypothetical protein